MASSSFKFVLCFFFTANILFFTVSCKKNKQFYKNFKRTSFEIRTCRNSVPLKFDDKFFEWTGGDLKKNNTLCKDIINGKGIIVNQRCLLILKPFLSGKKGIAFNIFGRCIKNNLKIEVFIRRGKTDHYKEVFKIPESKRLFITISKEIEFSRNDIINVQTTGKGILIVSDVVIYDIIPRSKRNHVFLIALDNCRKDVIGKRINGILLTPNINRFIADAVYFDNVFAQSSWTYPSFMSMFSGLYEHRLNLVKESFLPAEKPFLIEAIAQKFITVNLNGGAWMQSKHGYSRGFDMMGYVGGAELKQGGRELFSRAINLLEKKQVPDLFMFLHTYHVHSPFTPSKEFLKKLNSKTKYTSLRNFSLRDQFKADVPAEKKKSIKELYEAEIMEFDFYFGEFIKYLKSKKIYDQSLIVFVSDHGEEFYEHRGWFHGQSLYNELIEIPMIVKFPQNKFYGKTVGSLTGLIDLFPTLLDFYGIPINSTIDGASLMPSIRYDKKVRETLWTSTSCSIFEQLPVKVGVVFSNFKLLHNFPYEKGAINYYSSSGRPPESGRYELYNIKKDPKERINIYGKKIRKLDEIRIQMKNIIKMIKKNRKIIADRNIKIEKKEREKLKSLGYIE